MRTLLLALSVLSLGFAPAPFLSRKPEPVSLTGEYVLYFHNTREDGPPVARFAIRMSGGETFTIAGVGQSWTGEGRCAAGRGHYDWVFTDGRRGRTTFTLTPEGGIAGHVVGGDIDWRYVARRVTPPGR